MQCSKRKAPIGLAAGIGARTTHNILERTEMNTSTHNADAAIKPSLTVTPVKYVDLAKDDMSLVTAFWGLNDSTKDFIVRLVQDLVSSPLHAKVVRPSLRLVQGGAA